MRTNHHAIVFNCNLIEQLEREEGKQNQELLHKEEMFQTCLLNPLEKICPVVITVLLDLKSVLLKHSHLWIITVLSKIPQMKTSGGTSQKFQLRGAVAVKEEAREV